MDEKSWHWFVSGIMYRAESNKTAPHTEARQRFEKEYDLIDLENNHEIAREKLPEFAEHCLKQGLKSLYVTLDSSGVMAYTLEHGKLVQELVTSVKVDYVIDNTGC